MPDDPAKTENSTNSDLQNNDSNTTSTSATVNAIVQLPNFDENDVETWLVDVEDVFVRRNVVDEAVKASLVRAAVHTNPANRHLLRRAGNQRMSYSECKTELVQIFASHQEQRIVDFNALPPRGNTRPTVYLLMMRYA